MKKKTLICIVSGIVAVLALIAILGAVGYKTVQTQRLFQAIDDGNREQLQTAIQKGANVNGRLRLLVLLPSEYGNPTPLVEACLQTKEPHLPYDLLNAGADPNLADSVTGVTPLFNALHSRQYALAGDLLDRGADVAKRSKDSLRITLETYYFFCMSSSPADSEGHRMLERLYELGAPLTEKSWGKTVFHEAVICEDVYAIQFFLSREKDLLNQRDAEGRSPLELARLLAETAPSSALQEIVALLEAQ